MESIKIIVVEDESIVAKDIQNTLIKLGYDVPAIASNHAAAIEKIKLHMPNLVFMDIKLKGESDGVDIATEIKEDFDIPVIFLTSFVDKTTLDRAKVTEPYGYIVKPFNETDLRNAVELALYKYERDKEVKNHRQFYLKTIQSLEDPVIITDQNACITFINDNAKQFISGNHKVVEGKNLLDVFHIEPENIKNFSKNDVKQMLMGENNRINDQLFLFDGKNKMGEVWPTAIKSEDGTLSGCAIVLKKPGEMTLAGNGKEDTITPNNTFENLFLPNSFFVKKGSLLVKVSLENVLWVQAMDNYVIIKTDQDQFIIHSTMKDIESKLPANSFVRVHRSYIVSIDKITLLDENTVVISEKTIPIGKSYRDGLMNRLNFL